jgi:hypothetical protein
MENKFTLKLGPSGLINPGSFGVKGWGRGVDESKGPGGKRHSENIKFITAASLILA